jgi:tetratricopeptide (TPR) repeat protein
LLPRAGALVLAGLGAGAAIAYAANGPEPAQLNETAAVALRKAAHCMIAAAVPDLKDAAAAKAYEDGAVPLWTNLGSLSYPISTKNTEAQAYFDQGLRQAANFNHAEARRAFRTAQSRDPNCALCFLGEALVLGPNINVPMAPEANAPALDALRKAQALAAGATDKEKGLIEAVSTRYSDDPKAERPTLDAAFADAMAALSDKYPDDLLLSVMAAEAGMDTQPWDYWEPGGKQPKGRGADIQKRLEAALAKNPDDAWAMHLYIHFVEASDRPERGEPYADRLAALMPGAGHIVHMPSHIYFRIGRYGDALDTNKAASKVDEAYIAETGAVGVYPIGYYSHNIHFVLSSAQLLGEKETVLEQADKLDKWLSNEVASAIPITQPVKAAPYYAWAQYAEPDMVLALPDPPGAPPYVKAMWHYARGTAFAAKKDPAGARAEADAIRKILAESDWSTLDLWGIPARPVLEVAGAVVQARAAQAEGDQKAAVDLYETAAVAQDTIPYMEPPFWYYPVRQSLGAALLSTGRAEEAEQEFRKALDRERRNAWAVYGLKEAAKAKGDALAEKQASDDLGKIWRGDPAMLTLGRM